MLKNTDTSVASFKAARARLGLTIRELAEVLGYHHSTVANWTRRGDHVPLYAARAVQMLEVMVTVQGILGEVFPSESDRATPPHETSRSGDPE